MKEAETGAAQKVFDLDLPELGPYNLCFTRSGRHMLLGGRKGHLAIMEWQQRHLVCEVQVSTGCNYSLTVLSSSNNMLCALQDVNIIQRLRYGGCRANLGIQGKKWAQKCGDAGERNSEGRHIPAQRAVLCGGPEEVRVHL